MLCLSLDQSADVVSLPNKARVGRLTGVELRIDEPTVANDHALFMWSGDHWIVRDLSSSSGTLVRGRRIAARKDVCVGVDDRIRFGDTAELRVVRADAPARGARPGTRAIVRGDGERFAVVPGSYLPAARPRTAPHAPTARLVATSTLVIQPSRDWDDIHAVLRTADGEEIDLAARSINILLYVLARHAVDEHGGNVLSRHTEGWLHRELVARRVGEDRKWVNTSVFRLRDTMRKHGLADADDIVCRDETDMHMRIGVMRAELLPEGP